jgi:putative transposase
MEAEKATYNVTRMARLLEVSRSGYYDWAARRVAGPTPAQRRREQLSEKIKTFTKPRTTSTARRGSSPICVRTVRSCRARRSRH